MKRGLVLSLLFVMGLALSASAPAVIAQSIDHKVLICHIPPGNPENAHTIVVDYHAVPAHLEQHGDFLGFCDDGGSEGQ